MVATVEFVEYDEDDCLDNIVVGLVKNNIKIVGGKKISSNVSLAPMEKVSFHSERVC